VLARPSFTPRFEHKMKGYAMRRFASQGAPVALYSPPQIYRRLPKKEPRPRQGKSMTIAAGFRCYDGVVLCTDSEHTVGQSKFYEKKIFRIDAENATAFLAGAGHDVYIKSAADEIASAIEGKIVSLDQIKVAVEEVVSGLYEDHFAASHQVSDPDAPRLSLLLAVKVNDAGIKPGVAAEVIRGASDLDPIALQKLREQLDDRRLAQSASSAFGQLSCFNTGRGRDSGYPPPPAQTRAGASNAHGSYLGSRDA